ncbi:HYR domain-containing protein [Pyxidicoccus fallax]|uniref:HYR domain-containing protein n=1 Tax=Pyxidicoccus fallax TaxID=394095 RepID=A0A848L5H0_9BACT|nr:ELWxxDGT repeat protein [Pyxidicoccus fallax]NMO13949.1 HYR domain-containing protein [Pyxidicoccus fallax]NPC78348.1 HYR domain-containing protein [Pyxidicoccus fallax]
MNWTRQAPALLAAGVMVGLIGCSEPADSTSADATAASLQRVDGPALLRDIDTRPALFPRLAWSRAAIPLPSGGTLVALKDELTGAELWKTDGTEAGTTLVKEFAPGFWSSTPSDFTELQGAIYFSAEMDFGLQGLWKTDGTAAGTVLVKSFPNLEEPDDDTFRSMAALGGALYFIQDEKLWKSDGTEAGTVSIQALLPATVTEFHSGLVPVGNALYFLAEDSVERTGLWKTDGTAAGTVRLKNLYTGAVGGYTDQLHVVGSTVFFTAGDFNRELWKTDGTVDGTQRVFSQSGSLGSMRAAGPYLYFGRSGALWRTNGTEAGTVELPAFSPDWMMPVGQSLFFEAQDELGREPWVSDGTREGTRRVKDLLPGEESSNSEPLGVVNGRLLLASIQVDRRVALWSSDGSEAGTVLLAERGIANEFFLGFTGKPPVPVGSSSVIVELPDFDERGAVFRTDGTAAGTVGLGSVRTGTKGSQLTRHPLAVTPGKVFFTAEDENGMGLWVSDATSGGTTRLRSLARPVSDSASVGSTLFFGMDDGTSGLELWKSDGTVAGTVRVKDINSGAQGSIPMGLLAFNGTLYFSATTEVDGRELWKSDGTADGTVMVKPLLSGFESSDPEEFTVMNGTLFFSARDENYAGSLWKTDGTADGTTKVKDLEVDELTVGGNTLYFFGEVNGESGLWKSDGTADGTVRIRAGLEETFGLTWAGGRLYFLVQDEAHGFEPWVSDGTEAGTRLLKDIQPGASPSFGTGFTQLGNRVLFFARDDEHGFELWRTDGTEAGTVRVTDLMQGPTSSVRVNAESNDNESLFERVALEDRGLAVFVAQDAEGGLELWATDGTTEGTFRHADLAPGAASSAPTGLVTVGGQLVFFAGDAAHGREPRAVPLPVVPDTTDPVLTCPNNVLSTTDSTEGTTVEYTRATAVDANGPTTVTYSHPSGSRFPLGFTEVTVTATDAAGNTARCTFTVQVTLATLPAPGGEVEASGCGCTSGLGTGAGAGWGLLLLALASLRSRRRA